MAACTNGTCYGSCEGNCYGGCEGDCYTASSGGSSGCGCTGSCSSSCGNNCSGDCEGGCSGGCNTTCTGKCASSCSGSCDGGCKGDCEGGCSGGCGSECRGACSGTCGDKCNTACTADNQAENIANLGSGIAKGKPIKAEDILEVKNAIVNEFKRRNKTGYTTYTVEPSNGSPILYEHGRKILEDCYNFNNSKDWRININKSGIVAKADSLTDAIEYIKTLMNTVVGVSSYN
jgi:hypothetical protein